ncbi:hypothetical protein [Ancylobacter sp. FA202]|uniref:hypothetical protein n=1 Tax=Ancylobacter sp. FA202 TaxID=1111106 RepID=UPI0018DEE0C7|nr:hypothetical protein [Ancylobacter sp. FA202]
MASPNSVLPRGFTWTDYSLLIQEFLNAGYRAVSYGEFDPTQTHVIIRHDIDFSLSKALDIALIEAEGVSAHYFVLLRTEFYNICSHSDLEIVEKIRDLGHEIGLHFDAARYEDRADVLQAAAHWECVILESIVSRPVTSISFHRPANSLLAMSNCLAGRQHTYQPKFFSDVAYCSDSQGAFRFGHPLDREAFRARAAMQLLTHPIWWTPELVPDRLDLIDRFLDGRSSLLRREAAANCQPYAKRLAEADGAARQAGSLAGAPCL